MVMIQHDAYYKDVSHLPLAERARINFDHPDALETDLMVRHLRELIAGRPIEMPVYDFSTHTRLEKGIVKKPAKVIIIEGILIFCEQALRDLMDVKIFVDTDSDLRFIRRLKRDIQERQRSMESVIGQYLGTVRPMHVAFVEPSRKYADIIIPEGHNPVSTAMVVTMIRQRLRGGGRDDDQPRPGENPWLKNSSSRPRNCWKIPSGWASRSWTAASGPTSSSASGGAARRWASPCRSCSSTTAWPATTSPSAPPPTRASSSAARRIRVHGLNYIVKNADAAHCLLIVDDVYDTGLSIKAIIDSLNRLSRRNTPHDIRVATVFFKPGNNRTERRPDYFVHETDKWLVFPHELKGLSPEEIARHKPEIARVMQGSRAK